MAESSDSENNSSLFIPNEVTIPPTLKFLMGNVKNIANVVLASDNYAIWSAQITKLLTANGFQVFLEESTSPPQYLTNNNGEPTPNPNYYLWKLIDQNLAVVLCSTVLPSILPYVLHLTTTKKIWQTLQKRLQGTNKSRVIQHKNKLHNMSLKTKSVTEYLTQVKMLVDGIAAAGSQVDQEDIILYILNGLPASYQAFKTSILTSQDPIFLDDLYSYLLAEEINIVTEQNKENLVTQQAFFTTGMRGRNGNYRGSCRYQQSKRPSNRNN